MAVEYLAVPQGLSLWLTKTSNAIETLAICILQASQADVLRSAVHAVDTFRATISADGRLLVAWNTDYQDSSGAYSWAFISLDKDCGAARLPELSTDFIERALKVAKARLAKSKLPQHYRLRIQGNFKTCTAGGRDAAAHHSLAFWEGEVSVQHSRRFAVMVVGPDDGPTGNTVTRTLARVLDFCQRRVQELPTLIATSDATIQKATLRPACTLDAFRDFEQLVAPRQTRPTGPELPVESVPTLNPIDGIATYTAQALSYDDWVAPGSPLTREQREILGTV